MRGRGLVLEVVVVEAFAAGGAEDFVLVDDAAAVVAAVRALFFGLFGIWFHRYKGDFVEYNQSKTRNS